MTEEIIAYKAFNADWTCRGFEYEVGKKYKQKGDISCCKNGFHACENPLDTLNYYKLIDDNGELFKFAEVTLSGETNKRGDNDTKIAAAEITIKAELILPDFIKRSIKWVMNEVRSDLEAASGSYSQLASSDDDSKLAASGNDSQLASSGGYSKIAASGYESKIAASGHESQIVASGRESQIAASGDDSKIASCGIYNQLAASGSHSQIASSGYDSKLAASGYDSRLAASGYESKIAASGSYSKITASGDHSRLAASGNHNQLAASGEDSVIASSGRGGRAKGKEGTWIALASFDDEGKCNGYATGCIGKNNLKADTWYRAENGKLVEADQ